MNPSDANEQRHSALTLLSHTDERVAISSAARLLITATTQRRVETLARRIHGAGQRARLPFVQASGQDLPLDAAALTERCSRLHDAAALGTLLIADVHEMPGIVQDVWLEWLERLHRTWQPLATARLISGTTVSLFDCVIAGTFSKRLFYRLNVIHLIDGDNI